MYSNILHFFWELYSLWSGYIYVTTYSALGFLILLGVVLTFIGYLLGRNRWLASQAKMKNSPQLRRRSRARRATSRRRRYRGGHRKKYRTVATDSRDLVENGGSLSKHQSCENHAARRIHSSQIVSRQTWV